MLVRCIPLVACMLGMPLGQAHAGQAPESPLQARTDSLLARLADAASQAMVGGSAAGLHIDNCAGYPYHDRPDARNGRARLLTDLREGLRTGLQCLSGGGPMGRLHPYHEYQAHRLISLFESDKVKTLRCVADQMFATAVATSPHGTPPDDPLSRQLNSVQHPAMILDTFRLGGILSRRHDDATYRSFFHLGDAQIFEHRNGQPLRSDSLHRYRNRAGLLFHEAVHWLGHEHSAIYPDVTHLYETCCFGGSDYISDSDANREHQAAACSILKDDALWSHGYTRYRQMRIWRHKGYDALKKRIRDDYDT